MAQHSLLVEAFSGALQPELPAASRLTVLLHDAAEYVLGDVISPFKAVIGDGYTAVEARLSSAIYLRFGLPRRTVGLAQTHHEAVRSTRCVSRGDEACGLRTRGGSEVLRPTRHLTPWPISTAQRNYLDRFELLTERAASPSKS